MPRDSELARAEALASRVTIGIITALPKEMIAVKAMLDEPVEYSVPGRAKGAYWLGEVPAKGGGSHAIVLVAAGVGGNLAAARATLLLERFPRVSSVLVVGIAGGAPDPSRHEFDVRLGDVVVSDHSGVIQYDFVKETSGGGFIVQEPRHPPRPPSSRLWDAVLDLEAAELEGQRPWEESFKLAKSLKWTRRPSEGDELHDANDPKTVVPRLVDPRRRKGKPRIFRGPIASGNKLLKDAILRERLRVAHGVKAIEMEASGIADASWLQSTGYLVVRGICDYCDVHKTDAWQGYAAMVAAAYTRSLLSRVRSDDPGTSDEEREAEPPDVHVPNNLPRRRPFFGRTEELCRIEEAFTNGRRVSVTQTAQMSLLGFGGVGKTALALEYAHRSLSHYPGGVWWLLAEGKPIDAMVRLQPILQANAPEPVRRRIPPGLSSAAEIADVLRVALQSCPLPSLLVLDNVEDKAWQDLLPGGEVRLLVTTRDEQFALGARTAIGRLEPEDALALAKAIAGEPGTEEETRAMERVVFGELDRLAVAVEMAARAVAQWTKSWVSYEKHLDAEMVRLLEDPRLYGDYGRGVFAALDISIARCGVDTPERKLLEGVAAFAPDDVPRTWALTVAGIPPESLTAAAAFAALEGLGLVTADDGALSVSMHRLVQKRVRDHWTRGDDEGLRRGVKGVAGWLEQIIGVNGTNAAVDFVREHVLEMLQAAEERGWRMEEALILDALATHFYHRGSPDASRVCGERAVQAAEQLDPPEAELLARCKSNLGGLLLRWGQPEEALELLQQVVALEEGDSTVHPRERAIHFSMLGLAWKDLGNPVAARSFLERAIAIGEAEVGSKHPDVVIWLSSLATVVHDLGDLDRALALNRRALSIMESSLGRDHPEVARILGNTAMVLRDLGRIDGASRLVARALEIEERHHGPEHPMLALHRWQYADLLASMGKRGKALEHLHRARALAEKMLPPNHPYRRGMDELLRKLQH